MIKLTLWILFLACVFYSCLCLFLYWRQRSLLYFPHPPASSEDAEVLWLENDDQKIKIWTVKHDAGPALIYFGGNAEDVSVNLPFFKELIPDYSLYLMNYRGYGGSTGTPTEVSLYADSLALYELVRRHHGTIVVMGRSLGTGIATYLASRRPVTGVILVTPFSSIAALASNYYPFIPVSPLLRDRYDSQSHAADITAPMLALTAEHDEIIPRRITDDLISSCKAGLIKNIIIKGTGHNSIEQSSVYRSHLRQFLGSMTIKLSEVQ